MEKKLFTFLLVDDEEIIREGISTNIDWKEEGFNFLPPCSDGLEAIESIKKNQPHVVLTDICMPYKDGLEVAAFIRENYPETLILILSGYDEFEYAQKAVSSQVMDYLLKPISSRTLKKHLKQIYKALLEKDKNNNSRQHMLDLLEKSREAVRDRFLTRLFSGRAQSIDEDIIEQNLQFLNTMDYFGILCLEIDSTEHNHCSRDVSQDLLFLTLQEDGQSVLKEHTDVVSISTAENRMVILKGEHRSPLVIQNLEKIAQNIVKKVNAHTQCEVSAGISLTVGRVKDIYTCYRQAVTALQNRLILGSNDISFFAEDQHSDLKNRIMLSQCAEDIRRDLRIGKKSDVLRTSEAFINILQEGFISSKQAKLEIVRFFSVIIDVLEEIGIANSIVGDSTLIDQLYEMMDVSKATELQNRLNTFLNQVSHILEEKRISYPQQKLNEILQYLKVHYADNQISVESIAERFFISTGYLTKLFRQHQGKSFLEYLHFLKMERAKELLKSTNMKNYEIAEAVGYKDPHYFSSSFKKTQGLSPSEYRAGL